MAAKRAEKKDWRSANIYIGIVAFSVIIIYISGYLWQYLNRAKVSIEVVEMGVIHFPTTQEGIVVRTETTVKAENSGNVVFAYNAGQRVKNGSLVCDIRAGQNTNAIEEKIADYDEQIFELQKTRVGIDLSKYSDDVKKIQSDIQSLVDAYVPNFIDNSTKDVLQFQRVLENSINQRNKILLSEESKATQSFSNSKQTYESQLNGNTHNYYAPQSGILSLEIDGYESVVTPETISNITKEQIKEAVNSTFSPIKSSVARGDGLFKIVTSNHWNIAAYIDSTTAAHLKEGKIQRLYIRAGNSEMQVDMLVDSMEERGEDYFVIFSSNNQMLNFLNHRTVKFEIRDNIYRGLKIPNNAITERTLLIVPTVYVTEQNKVTGLIIRRNGVPTFVPAKISSRGDEFDFVEQSAGGITVGDVVMGMDTELADYIIESVETIKGVYVANSGISEFKAVKILDSNMNYSIVQDNIKNSVKLYDRVVSDASNVGQNQMIY